MQLNATNRQSNAELSQEIERQLRHGSRTAAQLISALGISQPTLSRTIQGLSRTVTNFRVTGVRTPMYGLLRQLPMGLSARQRIYRHMSEGNIEPFADVEFLAGGATVERIGDMTRLYEGLPPYMLFAAPSGFLGGSWHMRPRETSRSRPASRTGTTTIELLTSSRRASTCPAT